MGWTTPRDWTAGELVTEIFQDQQIKGNMDYIKTELDERVTVYKTADETINNSSTLQNDDHLLFAIAANEEWVFDIQLFWDSDATADFKVALTVPSGATMQFGMPNAFIDSEGVAKKGPSTTASGGALALINGDAYNCNSFCGWVLNGATAGNVQFQWAQSTATAVDTIVRKGSFLRAYKVS